MLVSLKEAESILANIQKLFGSSAPSDSSSSLSNGETMANHDHSQPKLVIINQPAQFCHFHDHPEFTAAVENPDTHLWPTVQVVLSFILV